MKIVLTSLMLCCSIIASAQKNTLINNVQIFNGKDEKTIAGNILIENNLIKKYLLLP